MDRFPEIGIRFIDALNDAGVRSPDVSVSLRFSASYLAQHGWTDLPSWDMLKVGVRSPEPNSIDVDSGEWPHG